MYRIRKLECRSDEEEEPHVAWDCDNEDALFGPPSGYAWNTTNCGTEQPGSCKHWVDVMTKEWGEGDDTQTGHYDFAETCANAGWFSFFHTGNAICGMLRVVSFHTARDMIVYATY